MGAPVVQGRQSSSGFTTTPFTVDLPSSVAAGDLLIILFQGNAGAGGLGAPAGWTTIYAPASSSTVMAWTKAVGGETSVQVSDVSSDGYASFSWRISDWTAIMWGSGLTQTSANPNPPLVNMGMRGVKMPYLFLALTSNTGGSGTGATGFPSGYGNTQNLNDGTWSNVSSAELVSFSNYEDPGTFTLGGSVAHRVQTVGIRPVWFDDDLTRWPP